MYKKPEGKNMQATHLQDCKWLNNQVESPNDGTTFVGLLVVTQQMWHHMLSNKNLQFNLPAGEVLEVLDDVTNRRTTTRGILFQLTSHVTAWCLWGLHVEHCWCLAGSKQSDTLTHKPSDDSSRKMFHSLYFCLQDYGISDKSFFVSNLNWNRFFMCC